MPTTPPCTSGTQPHSAAEAGDSARLEDTGSVPGPADRTFFPADRDDDGAERAKAICRACPVRRDCVAYALADPTLTGVWGASADAQRRNRRRQLRQAG